MRVIEPAHIKRRSIKGKKNRSKKPLLIIIFLLLLIGLAGWWMIRPQKIASILNPASVPAPKTLASEKARTKMRTFTSQEFVNFYTSFAYPNTSEITVPPSITGNDAADERIRSLAEARGYVLHSVPVLPPVKITSDYELQQKAVQPFLDMQAAALKTGATIDLTAAFRSIDTQRELFLSRLTASLTDIAAGTADASVNQTLNVTAPPGYSRHHTGFTVDLACGNIGGQAFLGTNCYEWLSANNFANAKNYGWIPSYPQGIKVSGPEPEPWEFVWVDRDSLLE